MNKALFTGKIYNMKDNGKTGKDANVNFRLAVPKAFVTDADKKAGEYNHFLTVNGWGPRAEQLAKFFGDGDYISVDTSWDPFKGNNGEVPQFRLNDWFFPAGVQKQQGNGGNSNSRDNDERESRGGRDRDDNRSERGSSRDTGSRRGATAVDEDEAPPRRGSRRGNDGGGDDNTPF